MTFTTWRNFWFHSMEILAPAQSNHFLEITPKKSKMRSFGEKTPRQYLKMLFTLLKRKIQSSGNFWPNKIRKSTYVLPSLVQAISQKKLNIILLRINTIISKHITIIKMILSLRLSRPNWCKISLKWTKSKLAKKMVLWQMERKVKERVVQFSEGFKIL